MVYQVIIKNINVSIATQKISFNHNTFVVELLVVKPVLWINWYPKLQPHYIYLGDAQEDHGKEQTYFRSYKNIACGCVSDIRYALIRNKTTPELSIVL